MLEVNSFYELRDYERLENVNDSVQYICYNLLSTKGYNSSLIFYSYICYFKCAVNCIIHNPVFKYMLKLESDKPPNYEKLQHNKYYSFIEYVQRGGSELWELLKCNKDIFDIVDFYNNIPRLKPAFIADGVFLKTVNLASTHKFAAGQTDSHHNYA